uniref:RNase H type-1 domain-containing protein n=1 Tax=Cannabis sativa TaxID=3483 RepID=A0A803QKQ1_CANSA
MSTKRNTSTRSPLAPPQLHPGAFKLNVDAALDVRGHCTGLSVVVSNWEGHIIEGLSAPKAGGSSHIFVEAQALLHTIQWCSTIRFSLYMRQIVFN